MIRYIPFALIYLRVLISVFILFLAKYETFNPFLLICLMYIGIFSDILDGIVARKHNVSTVRLRVLDTIVDLFFYGALFLTVFQMFPNQMESNYLLILTILCLEFGMYLISIIKFKKLPSPHAILSKFWGIYLTVELTLLFLNIPGSHFFIALCIGIFIHFERFLIYAVIVEWDHDIPSLIHAFKLRKGQRIKRNTLFN